MSNKYDWDEDDTISKLWWKAHEKALKQLPQNQRQIITKFNFEQWATNNQEVHVHNYISNLCELYSQYEEDTDHVLRCTHIPRALARQKLVNNIQQFLQDKGTPDDITTCFMYGWVAWFSHEPPPPIQSIAPNASELLRQAYEDQTTIGWRHVLRGRLATSWVPVLQHAMENREPPRGKKTGKQMKFASPEAWAVKLIMIMWTNIILIWEVRNNGAQQFYTDKGLKCSHGLLVQAAEQETQNTALVVPQDLAWITKSTEELRAMHPTSLQYWMNNIQKLKKWGKKFYKTNNTEVLQFTPNK